MITLSYSSLSYNYKYFPITYFIYLPCSTASVSVKSDNNPLKLSYVKVVLLALHQSIIADSNMIIGILMLEYWEACKMEIDSGKRSLQARVIWFCRYIEFNRKTSVHIELNHWFWKECWMPTWIQQYFLKIEFILVSNIRPKAAHVK